MTETIIPTQLPAAVLPDLAVATDGIWKWFGRLTALRGVSLQIPRGATYLLLGPNGAGKSTLFKIILDLVRADRGTATVFGLDVRTQGPLVRANVGYVPEFPEWGYGWMRVGQLLAHHASYFPSWDRAYADKLARLFQIEAHRRVRTLSRGQARRIHLIMALAHRPPLLLLEEPTDGLDPLMRDETLGVLTDHLADSETTMLVSTRHVEEVARLVDYVGVLRQGMLRAQLSLDALQKHLHHYRVEVPEGWHGVPALNDAVLRRVDAGREVQWTVWGETSKILQLFSESNATVRQTMPLSLIDAAMVLLGGRDSHSAAAPTPHSHGDPDQMQMRVGL